MHEETPVELIIGDHSLEHVFQEVDSILKTSEQESIVRALGFVRDANLYEHPFRDSFREKLVSSKIWETLQELLCSPDFSVRGSTVYTIGKLTNRERAYLLSDAFPFYLKNDPINLPKLLLELLWLTNKWNWEFVEQVAAAKHYLVRWSLCQLLDDSGDLAETRGRFLEILAQLKCDLHPMVAAEANFRFERVNVKLGPKLQKSEWRKEVKRIASLEPQIMFESTGMQFMRNRSNYSLDDFDRFVTSEHRDALVYSKRFVQGVGAATGFQHSRAPIAGLSRLMVSGSIFA